MPGLTKSISCNGRAGSCDLLEASGSSEDQQADVEWTKQTYLNDQQQQSPSKKTLATLFVRKRLDLARQASPIMSHQSSPSEVMDPNSDKPLHLEAFIKSLGVFTVSSMVLMLSSLLLMCAFGSSTTGSNNNNNNNNNNNIHSKNSFIIDAKTNRGSHHGAPSINTTQFEKDGTSIVGDTDNNFLLSGIYDKELLRSIISKERDDNGGDDDSGDRVNALLSAGIALTAYVFAASLVCFLVCSMQCFFVSKVLDLTDGYDRAYKYICVCSRTRTLAVTGLFTSVPVLITGVIVFLMSKESSSHFTTGTIFCVLGGGICIVCAMHNFYHWRKEKTRADLGLPVYDSHFSIPKNALMRGSPKRQKELCTMV